MKKYQRFFRTVLLVVCISLATVGISLTGSAPVRPQNKNLYETEQSEKREEEDEDGLKEEKW